MYSVPGKVLFESMAPTDVNDPDRIVDEDTNIEARDKEGKIPLGRKYRERREVFENRDARWKEKRIFSSIVREIRRMCEKMWKKWTNELRPD